MIEYKNVTLRNWQQKDIRWLVKNANNKKIWDNLRDEFPYPYTEMAAKQWIEIVNRDNPLRNFAIVYKAEAVGGIGINILTDVFRKNAEIGYWIGEKYWNKGIASKALKAMVDYTFEKFDVVRIFAHVFENNESSIRILEKCGFLKEAKLKKSIIKNNQILDCYIYALLKP